MKLLDISEPEEIQEEEILPAIGIDLGTTNSLVACSKESRPEILPLLNGNYSLPSIASYVQGDVTVGMEKKGEEVTVLKSTKRLMGKSLADYEQDDSLISKLIAGGQDNSKIVNLKVGNGQTVTAVEVAAEILRYLRDSAEKKLNSLVTKAVITVPAYFDDAARSATKQAAELAGLETLRLLNEPTAAALAYGLDENIEGLYLVYDFGGGTFDVSLLDMQKGIFKVVATGGDTNLGGDDIDKVISDEIEKKYLSHIKRKLSIKERYSLLAFAKRLKELLTEKEHVSEILEFAGEEVLVEFSKAMLDELVLPFLSRTLKIVESVIADGKYEKSAIKEVILVGGSTRIPFVKEQIAKFFAKEPLCSIDPEKVVALGAALQAEALTYGTNNLLVDVLPLSLGLETMGGLVEKIVERNTPIPVEVTQEFTSYEDGQTGMLIHILQGERELVLQNRSLAKFILHNLPNKPAGKLRVKITLRIDRDGILTVSAVETSTGASQEVQVKPSFGLGEEEILAMLKESMHNAKSDIKDRMQAKFTFEIKAQVKGIGHLVRNESSFFSKSEIKEAEQFMQDALDFLQTDPELELLQDYQEKTKDFLNNLAIAKVKKITASLKGKNIEDLENLLKQS